MESSNSNTNKRIAKNTIYLYLRKLITIVINIYASRLLLQALGVDDYGLYGIVGSVIVMFSALRSLFSSSIQRYINVANGENDSRKVNEIFSIGVKIHIVIALIFFITCEIGGLIMIPTLNIPDGSRSAAYWILQFSIFTSVVSIMTVPYDALIIANEKFNAFAVLSVIECVLKLCIIYLIFLLPSSRVIVYSFLLFVVQLIIRFANAIYCRKSFGKESKFRNIKNPKLMKELSKFAGWQFFGNFAGTVSNASVNIILNLFGGIVANAARTIAYQILHIIQQFSVDVSLSFTPQITQNFSENRNRSFNLMILNSKASFVVSSVIAFVFFCSTPEILNLWLGEIPKYSVGFVRMIMFYILIRSLHGPIDVAFKASGNIRNYQISEFVILLLNIPICWLVLTLGAPLYSVFIAIAIIEMINLIAILNIAKHQFGFNLRIYANSILYKAFGVILIFSAYYYCYELCKFNTSSFFPLLINSTANGLFALIISSLSLFTKQEFLHFMNLIRKKKSL